MVFATWSLDDVHYVLIFATYKSQDDHDYSTVMLGFSRFENENLQDTAEYICFAKFVLYVFGTSISNVDAFTGDNCDVKEAFFLLWTRGLAGLVRCASHRFNFAASEILNGNSGIVNVVHKSI